MAHNSNMANREVCDLIFLDYTTKKPFLNLDYANVTTNEITSESVFATGGKGAPRRVSFNGQKTGTLTIETQIQTTKLWSLITGASIEKTATFIKREVLVSAEAELTGKITLSEEAVAGSVAVYKADDDCGTELAGTLSAKEFTFTEEVGAGVSVIAYYLVNKSTGVERLSIKADTFPRNFVVYGDTIMKTEDDEILPYKFVAYKCAPQSNLSLSYSNSGDPTTLTITCDLMADGDDNMLDLILIEE